MNKLRVSKVAKKVRKFNGDFKSIIIVTVLLPLCKNDSEK